MSQGAKSLKSRSLPIRAGFTLVELLVVITIIGLLVALLFPAISAALRAARRTQCVNNLRNLGQGVQAFHTKRSKFPGSVSEMDNANTPANNADDYWITWQAQLLPEIEQQPVFDAIKLGGTGQIANLIQVLKCPEHDLDANLGAPNSYIANCGRADDLTKTTNTTTPFLPIEHKANGVFFRHFRKNGSTAISVSGAAPLVSKRSVDLSLDEITDGTSNTLMLSESIQAGPWATNSSNPANAYNGQIGEQYVGMIWHPAAADASGLQPSVNSHKINFDKDAAVLSPEAASAAQHNAMFNYARPSSDHIGGVNAAMCDGSVRWISEDISYAVYCLILSSNGQKIWEPGKATSDVSGNTLASTVWLQQVFNSKDLDP